MKFFSISTAVVAASAAAIAFAAAFPEVPYPEGHRSWRHVKTMVVEEGHPLYAAVGGIHHVYANERALDGYRTGKFADGAVLAFDLLEANGADHAIVEGKRKMLAVMHKDAKRFAATDGWGFESFAGDSKTERMVGANAASMCFGCHSTQKQRDYVFSSYRE